MNQIKNDCQISFNSLLYLINLKFTLRIHFQLIGITNAKTGIIYCIACIYSLFVALIQPIAEQHYRLYESNQYERGANQASRVRVTSSSPLF